MNRVSATRASTRETLDRGEAILHALEGFHTHGQFVIVEGELFEGVALFEGEEGNRFRADRNAIQAVTLNDEDEARTGRCPFCICQDPGDHGLEQGCSGPEGETFE